MQAIEAGPLLDVRFRLRTFLAAVTVICVSLAFGFNTFCFVFSLASGALALYSIWLAGQYAPRYLGILIICHVAIAAFLSIGPILSYHLNGRAWYDYGLSNWDPPPSQLSDGTVGVYDYDPKSTPPAVWPIIGPLLYVMCWLSFALVIFPPTGPIVSIACFVLAIRLRHVLTTRQNLVVWIAWGLGLPPLLYLIFWGGHVLEWIAD